MPKSSNYTDAEILLALILSMPKKMTKGQIGRVLGIRSAGQKHWRERLERLGDGNLLSVETLDTGEMFCGSPILTYHLTEENLGEIWKQYFTYYSEGNGAAADPFREFFSAGIWDVTRMPEFSKLVGSKFNYHFLCASNNANPLTAMESVGSVGKEKYSKSVDAVLSMGWKIEAYRRKPVLMDTLSAEKKETRALIDSLYNGQIAAHPADYKKFTKIFDKCFKPYI